MSLESGNRAYELMKAIHNTSVTERLELATDSPGGGWSQTPWGLTYTVGTCEHSCMTYPNNCVCQSVSVNTLVVKSVH